VVQELNTSVTRRHSVSHCALELATHKRWHWSAPSINCKQLSMHFFAGSVLQEFLHLRTIRRPSHGFGLVVVQG